MHSDAVTTSHQIAAEAPRTGAARGGAEPSATGGRLRGLLLALLILGIVGLAAELFLLDHTESPSQWIPFVALGAGLIAAVAVALRPARASILGLRVVLLSLVAAGLAGVVLHYRGNVEFELEMYPELEGLELFWEAMTGATPALAPGALAQLGLLGLAFTYRHPALRSRAATPDPSQEEST